MNYGSDKMKREIIPEVLAGRKFISLAISEAFAGSVRFLSSLFWGASSSCPDALDSLHLGRRWIEVHG